MRKALPAGRATLRPADHDPAEQRSVERVLDGDLRFRRRPHKRDG